MGEAPNPNQSGGLPLESLAPKLLELSGIASGRMDPYLVLLEHFDVMNASEEPKWSNPLARQNLLNQLERRRPKIVILLGKRAGAILEFKLRSWNWWALRRVLLDNQGSAHVFLAVNIPHPSGRCRLYNDLNVIAKANLTLRQALLAAQRLSLKGETFDQVAQSLLP